MVWGGRLVLKECMMGSVLLPEDRVGAEGSANVRWSVQGTPCSPLCWPHSGKEVTQSLPVGWGEMGSETFCVHLSQGEAGAHPQKPAIHGGLSGTSNRMFRGY